MNNLIHPEQACSVNIRHLFHILEKSRAEDTPCDRLSVDACKARMTRMAIYMDGIREIWAG